LISDTRAGSRRSVLLVAFLGFGLLLTLGGCGLGAGTQGTLSGDVVAGPTCPVEQAGRPCPPQPVADRQVTLETPGGATVATTTTDVSGRFSVAVAPGSYVVQVQIVSGQMGMRQVTPGAVTVSANHTTTIHIVLDTGIR
jgi:hypothetical protein